MPRITDAPQPTGWFLMRLIAVAAVSLACYALLPAVAQASPARDTARFTLTTGDVWIRDVTLISSERPASLPHAHVVVRGERIAYVGGNAPGGRASGVTVVKGAGLYLVPGLIDGHVHLADVSSLSPAAAPALVEAYFRQLPRSYVYFGFTTVVDLNIVDRERVDQIRKADVGPAVFDCGNALAFANGYPMSYLPPAARFERYPNFLYDPLQADSIPQRYSPEEHSPEAAVQRVMAGGGICVKGHYEPGFDPKAGKLPVPTEELMRRVRDASHPRLPFLLHANSLEAHRFAVAVGVDAVAHGLWNWGPPSAGGNQEMPEPVREVLDAERRAGIAYMPTSRVLGGLADLFAPAFLDDSHVSKVLPADLIAWYRTQEGQWFKREIAAGLEGLPPESLRAAASRPREALAYVAAHGGRILFGSDTPSAPTYANPPGYNGYLELREMEAAGIPPRQILAAATAENAQFFRLEDRYGTIEAGKIASLLLLRDDPLGSATAFDTIDTVILRGRIILRSTMAAKGN
jgi:imidazolonepropionase-like amidohydrolase